MSTSLTRNTSVTHRSTEVLQEIKNRRHRSDALRLTDQVIALSGSRRTYPLVGKATSKANIGCIEQGEFDFVHHE